MKMTTIQFDTKHNRTVYDDYTLPPLGSKDIFALVNKYLTTGEHVVISTQDRNKILVNCYDSKTLNEYWFPISDALTTTLAKKGIMVICNINIGGTHASYLVFDGTFFRTMLLLTSQIEDDGNDPDVVTSYTEYHANMVKKVTKIPGMYNYVNVVYDTFYLDVPYADDPLYLEISRNNYKNRPIYILEYLQYTLTEYVENNREFWRSNRVSFDNFLSSLRKFMTDTDILLQKNGLIYDDVSMSNIMIGAHNNTVYIKYIDIDSIKSMSAPKYQRNIIIREVMDKVRNKVLGRI